MTVTLDVYTVVIVFLSVSLFGIIFSSVNMHKGFYLLFLYIYSSLAGKSIDLILYILLNIGYYSNDTVCH
jgi:hypothetical protein